MDVQGRCNTGDAREGLMSDSYSMKVRREGYVAYKAYQDRTACPYRDHETAYGTAAYNRLLRKWWMEGWEAAEKGQKEWIECLSG